MSLKRGNDDVIDEDRSSKVGKTRTILRPMVPIAQDRFGESTGREAYIIYLCWDEPSDSDFTAGLKLCQQNCSVGVQKQCFQQDRTRHISLWDGTLTDSQVREIQFTEPPKLPTVAFKQEGWIHWTAGNYIEVEPASTKELKEILSQLPLPLKLNGEDIAGKVSCNHLLLYGKRGAGRTSAAVASPQGISESRLGDTGWG
jgi:hypothetical protein